MNHEYFILKTCLLLFVLSIEILLANIIKYCENTLEILTQLTSIILGCTANFTPVTEHTIYVHVQSWSREISASPQIFRGVKN